MVNSLGSQSTPPSSPPLNGSFKSSALKPAGSSTCRISMAEFLLPSTRSTSIRQWALWHGPRNAGPGDSGRSADSKSDCAIVVERVGDNVHVIGCLERAPDHQLAAAPHAVDMILPGQAAVAYLLHDRRNGSPWNGGIKLPKGPASSALTSDSGKEKLVRS